jgi:transposase, IS30 family
VPTRSGGPGSLPLSEKRERYLRLMSQGASNSHACRVVGVHRRTGMRWRHGRTVKTRHGSLKYEPIRAAATISARYLAEDERVQIADRRKAGETIRQIAAALVRSPSTVSREIRRNADEKTGQYQPFGAHKRSVQRRARPTSRKRWQVSRYWAST